MLEKPKPPRLKPIDIRRSLQEEIKNYSLPTWETWEDDIIKEFNDKVPLPKIAEKLQRSYSAVKARKAKLGIRSERFTYRKKRRQI